MTDRAFPKDMEYTTGQLDIFLRQNVFMTGKDWESLTNLTHRFRHLVRLAEHYYNKAEKGEKFQKELQKVCKHTSTRFVPPIQYEECTICEAIIE